MFYFLNVIYFKITYTVQTFTPLITTNLMTFAVKRTLSVLLFIQTNIHWRHITGRNKAIMLAKVQLFTKHNYYLSNFKIKQFFHSYTLFYACF